MVHFSSNHRRSNSRGNWRSYRQDWRNTWCNSWRNPLRNPWGDPLLRCSWSPLGLLVASSLTLTPPVNAADPSIETTAERSVIAQLTPFLLPTGVDRATLLREANRQVQAQNYTEAATLYKRLIELYPRDAVLHYKLGSVLTVLYRTDEAEQAYQQAINLESDYILAINGLGELYGSQSRWTEALRLFERAIAIEPSYMDAQINRGQALWQLGQDSEAIATLETVLDTLMEANELWKAVRVADLITQIERTQGIV